MINILEKIVVDKKLEVTLQKKEQKIDDFVKSALFNRTCLSAKEAILNIKSHGIISEFKRKSPSKGWIKEQANVETITKGYENAGASCISILTDEKYFGGTKKDLVNARKNISIPILRKEFIVDEFQLYESKAIGADFILLIAEILTEKEVLTFSKKAKEIGLEVLLEMHSEKQLDKICDTIDLVGINNRNLETFEVNLDQSINMLKYIPEQFVKIAESGISGYKEVNKLKNGGFEGFLIGENFMKQEKPDLALENFVKELSER